MTSDLKKCFVEFFGTFLLCLTILCCVLLKVDPVLCPFVIGFVLMVLVYAGGPISGGHYNPVVSLTVFLIGRMGSKKTLLYCIFQIFGAAYASLMFLWFFAPIADTIVSPQYSFLPLLFAEVTFSILLIYTVIFTAVSKRIQGNGYYGLAIGTSLMIGVATVGSVCLTAFNPAVAISLGLLNVAPVSIVLITIIANIIAAFATCFLFKLFSLDDLEKVEIVAIDEFIRQ